MSDFTAKPIGSMELGGEQERLEQIRAGLTQWQRWGTYLSERAWGTVREDYSADGDAWSYFPFEHSHSRAYRWNEDGLAGWCDRDQILCLGIALWNGCDPILKERPYGLSNAQGNHGEDVKDYWFYTDNLPTHAYASMTYKYPQAEFPYEALIRESQSRGTDDEEYELFDALREQWLEDRYFDVRVEYAKVTPEDVCCRITVINRGPDAAPIHVLPHLWYRNTWSAVSGRDAPRITQRGEGMAYTSHPDLGERWWAVTTSAGAVRDMVFCENESNLTLLFDGANASATTKDGINDFVVRGDFGAVSMTEGSKAAAHVTSILAAGESLTVLVRFAPVQLSRPFEDIEAVLARRQSEADEFYTAIAATDLTADERLVQRQALAGLLWSKQYYNYRVRRWLKGDAGRPPPPEERWTGRNSDWQHFAVSDVVLMPDGWEYPWFAAWDMAFHCVAMALIDPEFAKQQILLLQSSTAQHPDGRIPAYEWDLGNTNPPVLAWAAWQVYHLDRKKHGVGDRFFLTRVYWSETMNATWWLNQRDSAKRGVFGGGFLGMDNIGLFDRDQPLPTGGELAQVDGTAWMATLIFHLLKIAIELSHEEPIYLTMLGRWVWDAWLIANTLQKGSGPTSFWSDRTGFYHDVIEMPDGTTRLLEVFSIQGVVPLFAAITIPVTEGDAVGAMQKSMDDLSRVYDHTSDEVGIEMSDGDGTHFMLAAVGQKRLAAMLKRLLDSSEFLSPNGIRSMSKYHQARPYRYKVAGVTHKIAYQPAESGNRTFGGNSNWRGPVWMPLNFLIIQALDSYDRFFGDTFLVPVDSDEVVTLGVVADRLARRLTGLVVRDAEGRRRVFGGNDYFQNDPHWRDLIPFYEYFDGDTGRGLGASHQTGWTALVAVLLQFRGSLSFTESR